MPINILRPLAATLLVVVLLAATWVMLRVLDSGPPAGPAQANIGEGTGLEVGFDLVDHEGRPVTLEDFRGAPLMVVFGYTSCPDVCPTTLSRVATVLEGLEDEGLAARGAFITVDPERDTPEILARYVELFHERMAGLRGDERRLKEAALAFRVFYQKVGEDPEDDDYLVDHSAYVYLIGPEGDLLAYYHPDLDAAPMLADARRRLGG